MLAFFRSKSDLDNKITEIENFIVLKRTEYRTIAECGDIKELKRWLPVITERNITNMAGVKMISEKIDSMSVEMSQEIKKKVSDIKTILQYPNVELDPLLDNGTQNSADGNPAYENQNQADETQKPELTVHDRYNEMFREASSSKSENDNFAKDTLEKQTIAQKILTQKKSKSDLEKIVKSLKNHSEKIKIFMNDFTWENASYGECNSLRFLIREYTNQCWKVLDVYERELSYMIDVYTNASKLTRSTGGKNARKSRKSRKSESPESPGSPENPEICKCPFLYNDKYTKIMWVSVYTSLIYVVF